MKVVEGSTRGRGGGGRGRGRGGRGGDAAPPPQEQLRRPAADDASRRPSDPRFAGRLVQSRFEKMAVPTRENRVRPDDPRMARLQQDSRFRGAPVDSRGHIRAATSRPAQGGRMAPAEDEEEEETEDEEENDDDGSDEEMDDEEDIDAAAGAEEGEDDEVDDEDDVANFAESDVEEIEATRRVAIVNCDWDHIRSTDMFAVFSHCMPLGGKLHSVKVYLSDFGKEQLERERQHGPDLWVKASAAADIERVQAENAATMAAMQTEAEYVDVGGAPVEDLDDELVEIDDPTMFAEVGDEGEVFSGGKYRQYELSRMKYYYAIAEFDSPETAAEVYKECDGMDVEASGVVLDLRYVPDEETFDEGRINNSATRLPPNYKPLKAFRAAALSQTRFKISWDQDDPHRVQSLREAFDDGKDESDLKAYMASDSSSDEDEIDISAEEQSKKDRRAAKRAAIRNKYAALLADIGGLPEEMPEDGPEEEEAAAAIARDDSQDSDASEEDDEAGSDDDDLNRFSDVSMDEEEEGDLDEEDGSEDDDDVTGDKVGTFDLNAGGRAQQLQSDLRRKAVLQAADLGTAERMKYKLKRKEAKAAKKEALTARREEEDAAEAARSGERKELLKSRLGDAIEEVVPRAKGKAARKELAREIKRKAQEEKKELKKRRTVASLGGHKAVEAAAARTAAEAATQLDARFGRFADRLMNDPRYHVDPTSERAQHDRTVASLASTVSAARRSATSRPTAAERSTKARGDAAAEDVAQYFLQPPKAKRNRAGNH